MYPTRPRFVEAASVEAADVDGALDAAAHRERSDDHVDDADPGPILLRRRTTRRPRWPVERPDRTRGIHAGGAPAWRR
jgi:hypothetical protein